MQLAPEKRIRPPKIYGHKRLNLDITLVDADSGIVRATRQVSLRFLFPEDVRQREPPVL